MQVEVNIKQKIKYIKKLTKKPCSIKEGDKLPLHGSFLTRNSSKETQPLSQLAGIFNAKFEGQSQDVPQLTGPQLHSFSCILKFKFQISKLYESL